MDEGNIKLCKDCHWFSAMDRGLGSSGKTIKLWPTCMHEKAQNVIKGIKDLVLGKHENDFAYQRSCSVMRNRAFPCGEQGVLWEPIRGDEEWKQPNLNCEDSAEETKSCHEKTSSAALVLGGVILLTALLMILKSLAGMAGWLK